MTFVAPAPPDGLDHVATKVWFAAHAAAVRAGIWQDRHVLGLEAVARIVSQYLAMATLGLEADRPELRAIHRIARQQAFLWHLVATEAAPSTWDGHGVDPELARLAEWRPGQRL